MTACIALLLLAGAPRVAVPAEASPSRARYVVSRADSDRGLALPSHEAHGFSQRARLLADGSTEITVVSLPRGARPLRRPDLRPAVRGDVHPDVKLLAEELALDAADPWDASERILAWVSLNVRHEDEPSHDETAELTLQARTGSCVGRSLLAADLLRAAGIPARTVHGLLAEPGADPPFVLHRFVESWIDGIGWVPSDPGESIHVVDARHVFIATDDAEYDPESQRSLRVTIAESPDAPLGRAAERGYRALVLGERPPALALRSARP